MSQSNLVAGVAGAVIGYALRSPCNSNAPEQICDPGVSVGSDGMLVDANNNPILGDDGLPLFVQSGQACDPSVSVDADGMLVDADGNPVLGDDGAPLFVCADQNDGDGYGSIIYVPKEVPEGSDPIETDGDGFLYLEWENEEDPELFFYRRAGIERPRFYVDSWSIDGRATSDPVDIEWGFNTRLYGSDPAFSHPFTWSMPTLGSAYDYEGKEHGPISLLGSLGSVAFAVRESIELDVIANRTILDTGNLMPYAAGINHANFSEELWVFASDPDVIQFCDSLYRTDDMTLAYSDLIARGKDVFLEALHEWYTAFTDGEEGVNLTGEIGFGEYGFDLTGISEEAAALGVYSFYSPTKNGFAALLLFAQLTLANKDAIIDQLGGSVLRSIQATVGAGGLPISYESREDIITSLRTLALSIGMPTDNWTQQAGDDGVYTTVLNLATWLGVRPDDLHLPPSDDDDPSSTGLTALGEAFYSSHENQDNLFVSFALLYGSKVDHEVAASVKDYVSRPTVAEQPWTGKSTAKVVHPPVINTKKETGLKNGSKLTRITYAPKPPVTQWRYKGGAVGTGNWWGY